MRYAVSRGQVRVVYTSFSGVPSDIVKVFAMMVHMGCRELQKGEVLYQIVE